MTIPKQALAVAKAFERRDGAPPTSSDDARRAFFRKVAEQLRFDYRGPELIGVKRSSAAAPVCADCVAWLAGRELSAVDLQDGSTGEIRIIGVFVNIPGVFEEVAPTNHLGHPAPDGGGQPVDSEPLRLLFEEVSRIADGIFQIAEALEHLTQRMAAWDEKGLKFRVR